MSTAGSDLRILARQVRFEQRTYWRNPASAVFTFVLPLAFLVIFGSTTGHGKVSGLPDVTIEQYYVPAILTYGLVGAFFSNLAVVMCLRRDSGILKRVRGTPISSLLYIFGTVGSCLLIGLILAIITIIAGIVLYSVPFPHQLLPILVDVIVASACFCSLGLAFSTVVPNADSAPAIVNVFMLVFLFISGTFYPINPNSGVSKVANLFPVRHLVQALLGAVVPGSGHPAWDGKDLLVLLAWGAAGMLITVRRWRWETGKN